MAQSKEPTCKSLKYFSSDPLTQLFYVSKDENLNPDPLEKY